MSKDGFDAHPWKVVYLNYLYRFHFLVALRVNVVLVESETAHLVVKKKKYIWLKVSDVCEILGVCPVCPAIIVVLLTHKVHLLIV